MPFGKVSAAMGFQIGFKSVGGVFILQNKSRKLKSVADNAILLNYAASSEYISKTHKAKSREIFHLKVNVCKFR